MSNCELMRSAKKIMQINGCPWIQDPKDLGISSDLISSRTYGCPRIQNPRILESLYGCPRILLPPTGLALEPGRKWSRKKTAVPESLRQMPRRQTQALLRGAAPGCRLQRSKKEGSQQYQHRQQNHCRGSNSFLPDFISCQSPLRNLNNCSIPGTLTWISTWTCTALS
jgi:hypothetical protein